MNEWLDEIARVLNWRAIELVLLPLHDCANGRPAFPNLMMIRILLLQQWYDLSDPGIEQAVDDRLSFRKFVGLPVDRQCPDHSTIWRFREALGKAKLDKALFGEVNRQLDEMHLIVRSGTLIDASIMKAAVKPPPFKDGEVNPRDVDAGWTQKNGESHFGYKAHVAVDESSNLIRDAEISSADLHDSQMVYELIQGDEDAVYADKGYDDASLRANLAEAGIKDAVMYKAHKNKPLRNWQKWRNKAVSVIRGAVERSFAALKRYYGWTRARYIGMRRNGCRLKLARTGINLRRMLVLRQEKAA